MGVKKTGIHVLAVFETRTKLSKTGPKFPVIMVPGPKSLRGIMVLGDHNHADQIICDRAIVADNGFWNFKSREHSLGCTNSAA